MKQHYMVSEEQEDLRIDRYLAEACEELSRSYIQKLLKSQDVLVNGSPVKASYKVAAGDQIEVEVPEAIEPEIAAEEMDLDILYEDQDVILINKPKGMVVHPAAGHYTGTLVNGLMAHCKDELSGINGVMRPGIVHRIDMDTTGVLIVCKNDFAHNSIAAQLKEHSIIFPSPGIAKIDSVKTAPPNKLPNWIPTVVITGIRAFFNAWTIMIFISVWPFASAVTI